MNHFYLSKKSCFVSAILNIIGSLSLVLLIGVISYYHFVVLNGTGGNYSSLLTNSGSGVSTSTAVVNSPLWASSYISTHGYANFFQGILFGELTYWHVIKFFSVISILCFSTKTVLCVVNVISAIKAKSIAFTHAAVLDFFFPLVGGIMSLIICRDNRKMVEYKAVMPLQLVKTKIKNIFYQIFSDVNMKNL